MDDEATLGLIRAVVVLVGATAAVSIVARRFSIPYTVALVAFGLAGGAIFRSPGSELPPELVLTVLLPGLIFEAAYRMDVRLLRDSLLAVLVLAGPGVFVIAASARRDGSRPSSRPRACSTTAPGSSSSRSPSPPSPAPSRHSTACSALRPRCS